MLNSQHFVHVGLAQHSEQGLHGDHGRTAGTLHVGRGKLCISKPNKVDMGCGLGLLKRLQSLLNGW